MAAIGYPETPEIQDVRNWMVDNSMGMDPETGYIFPVTVIPAVTQGITEIDIVMTSVPVTAHPRKLKAVWSPDLSKDMDVWHGIYDLPSGLIADLSKAVQAEIDKEILETIAASTFGALK